MRSGVIVAAFAVGALAVPFQQEKRDVVTYVQYATAYQTDVVTVTAGGETAAASPKSKHRGHHKWGGWGHGHKPNKPYQAPAPQPEPTQSPEPAPQPAPQPSTSSKTASPSSGGSGGSAPSPPSDGSYPGIATYHHNLHRANHSAPDIQWSEEVAAGALQIAQSCWYAHNTDVPGGSIGQNIAAGVASDNISAIITDMFYNGEVGYYDGLYGQANPDMSSFESWGHFSQIVWKGTTEFGCATVDCSSKGLGNTGSGVPPFFTVCNYKAPGNMQGEYDQNIGEPVGNPTAQWNTGKDM